MKGKHLWASVNMYFIFLNLKVIPTFLVNILN